MYLWAALPPGCGIDDLQFCLQLVARAGIAISPGRGFGPGGVGSVRFALVASEEELRAAGETVGRFADELRAKAASAEAGGGGDTS
jgi:aspartate/methionine/tyrosine aminotransferase